MNDQTTDNYVHGNQDVGIWYDTDNAGALISGNYVSDNYSVGIQYEASYNARITNNTLVGNAIGEGSDQDTPGFPDGAIYISESGGDSRVASNYSGQLHISGNVLINNWGGVILWENSDRYCSDGSDNGCTLINPAVYTESSCAANLSQKSPVDYYDNCRWKTQNVTVENNTMTFDATTWARRARSPTSAGSTACSPTMARAGTTKRARSPSDRTTTSRTTLHRPMALLGLESEQHRQPRDLGRVDRSGNRSVRDRR